MDHGREGGPERLVTVAGGKMSDFRLMGEEAGDAACRWIGISGSSKTSAVGLDGQPVVDSVSGAPPSPRLKAFLDFHPRLRELHALSHLGWDYGRHLFSRRQESTCDEVRAHYKKKD